ncbi:flagellar biosynthesis protein FlgG [Helicobacter enhydrae]|uniref:Flagellar biosynthesis protein FlgG n=1 Tax=Helicobacter enhydrae TaxID=222136 RepID=A0A1B1U4V5_9HELI|nr:flagellar hook-basal body protein [Helicobacter enhydrae]ANV97803.1 flagellar biosynthesis protein FlgG [Helicobacter enhydrae]
MQSGYYSATGGMVTQFNRLDVIANNLANLNTNAYKRDDVAIGDFMRILKGERDELPIEDNTREAAQYWNRAMDKVPIVTEEFTDRALGAMSKTDNPLDFTLKKENAFFAVQTPDGVRYTRDGSFNLDENGNVVNKRGMKILSRNWIDSEGGIVLNASGDVAVTPSGNVFVRTPAGENVPAGALAIVSFADMRYLKKTADGLYEYVGDDLARDREMYENNVDVLTQGYLEKSNVNAVLEMTSLIETNRLVDMYQKVMKTHTDDLNTEAIQKLAVRA